MRQTIRIECGVHERCFAQTSCDKHGFVLDFEIVAGNIHDSQSFHLLYEKLDLTNTKIVALDAGFKTPAVLRAYGKSLNLNHDGGKSNEIQKTNGKFIIAGGNVAEVFNTLKTSNRFLLINIIANFFVAKSLINQNFFTDKSNFTQQFYSHLAVVKRETS